MRGGPGVGGGSRVVRSLIAGFLMAGWVAGLSGVGAAQGQGPAFLPNVEVTRVPGGAAEVRHLWCGAAGRADLQAALTLESAGPLAYQVAALHTNDAAHALLMAGRDAPQVRGLYTRYVVQGYPVGRVTLAGLLGTWKLFGLKFDWQGATYHCQLG
ncbi:hypothetical protein GCM10008937_15840 [Deinococcus depolymerans]|uniref:Uncharacterized protein n=1 Tax=Deinococcus depolymerans TaxID=392408 RepID=A0ABP3LZB1_9DEIO